MPLPLTRLLAMCLAFLFSAATLAQPMPGATPIGPRGDFSGTWYNPGQSGHGLFIEILDRGQAAVAWFTFDPAGAPIWLVGVLELDGWRLHGMLSTTAGGRFPPHFDPDQVSRTPWGMVQFEILGCNAAELRWAPNRPGFQAGVLAMSRLTTLQGQRCNVEQEFGEQRIFSFQRDVQAFEAVFVDLPVEGQDIYELDFGWEALPAPLDSRGGLRLVGHNRSDDLAMFAVAPIGGLRPNTNYRIELELELASNVPTGCVGIGGSPGDSVYIKLGASQQKPQAVTVNEGGFPTLRMNVDIGSQSQAGERTRVVGTLANTQTCEDISAAQWELKTVSTQGQPLAVRTDENGVLWVMAGTDSGFEGLTEVYFTALRVRLRQVEEGLWEQISDGEG
jgi:hypothetical protein